MQQSYVFHVSVELDLASPSGWGVLERLEQQILTVDQVGAVGTLSLRGVGMTSNDAMLATLHEVMTAAPRSLVTSIVADVRTQATMIIQQPVARADDQY